jgi:hypothetical protein
MLYIAYIQTYSFVWSPSGRRRPEVGFRIQPDGSLATSGFQTIKAATAASKVSYHQLSS